MNMCCPQTTLCHTQDLGDGLGMRSKSMGLNPTLKFDRTAVERFCKRWRVTEFGIFGSALREDFRPDSDVDVLVTFEAGAKWSLFDLMHMEEDLAKVLGRKVGLVERAAVEQSRNYIRRRHILETVERLYAA
jgi:uncharacterized protein